MDCRRSVEGREVEYTHSNVSAIVDELVRAGKTVIVNELLDVRHPDDKAIQRGFIGNHHLKNTKICELAEKYPKRVLEGANLTHTKYHNLHSFDRIHLDFKGYNMLANDLTPAITEACIRAETNKLLRKESVMRDLETKKTR